MPVNLGPVNSTLTLINCQHSVVKPVNYPLWTCYGSNKIDHLKRKHLSRNKANFSRIICNKATSLKKMQLKLEMTS